MENRTIVLVSILFLLIIAGMFGFTYLKSQEQSAVSEPTVDTSVPTNNYGITSITAKRFFIDNTHTIVGEINMPTPCDLLEVDAVVMESFPEQVRFDFTVLNTAEICDQVVTPQRFMVSAEASELADLQATFMGEVVTLNIIEAEPGETLDDFELYSKG